MSTAYSTANLPTGVSAIRPLPYSGWQDRWDRIFVDSMVKDRLRNYALFALTTRSRFSHTALPTHGLVVLSGPPGTGKTSLAYGLAQVVAMELRDRGLADEALFVVLDVHSLPSEMLGASQRAVGRLFEHTIPELAAEGRPLLILMDEVETLVVNRSRASFDTNPVDVHRATDAVLTGLDSVAERSPNVLFVATTNEITAVDAAFLSRADLVETVGLPSAAALEQVLRDSMEEIVGDVSRDFAGIRRLAARAESQRLDARQARKLVLRALTSSGPELVLSPEKLTVQDLEAALR